MFQLQESNQDNKTLLKASTTALKFRVADTYFDIAFSYLHVPALRHLSAYYLALGEILIFHYFNTKGHQWNSGMEIQDPSKYSKTREGRNLFSWNTVQGMKNYKEFE